MGPQAINYWLQELVPLLVLYLPLGVIGVWRWSTWVVKKVVALRYRPIAPGHQATTSIITPVYNEDPQLFLEALASWQANRPDEIIAVIDQTDQACITAFKRFSRQNKNAKLIVTPKRGKREALADGIAQASGEIVALVDSDTVWDPGVLPHMLAPFKDPHTAGVATNQRVLNPKTIAQKLFAIQLYLRSATEMPFLQVVSGVQSCLSGRTAVYRLKVLKNYTHPLVHEYFLGQKVISGEDKRLTYLLQADGHRVYYQSSATVATPGAPQLSTFYKQRLRWSRNAARADLNAMKAGWIWRYPAFALFLLDRSIQPFALLLSPVFVILSLALKLYLPAFIIVIWWFVSRAFKLLPYLVTYPVQVFILPIYVIANFANAIVRIYAIATMNRQGWITRWHQSRLKTLSWIRSMPAYAFILVSLAIIFTGTYYYKTHTLNQSPNQAVFIHTDQPNPNLIAVSQPTRLDPINQPLIQRHVVQSQDSVYTLASQYQVNPEAILTANLPQLPSWSSLRPGMVLSIPRSDFPLNRPDRYRFDKDAADDLSIRFEPLDNAIVIKGRGQQVNLEDVYETLGEDYVTKLTSKEWLLKKSILVTTGVTLFINGQDVDWLKLKSDSHGFVTLQTDNGNLIINNVKITSWDPAAANTDHNLEDGRSYLMAKNGARMDIYDSELAYLGFSKEHLPATSPFGVSWRMGEDRLGSYLLTGEVKNSHFHHNYFGAYTFGASGMVFTNNSFYQNHQYGLDPHDDSNWFIVNNNQSYKNGNHGIIFSVRCLNNYIADNLVYDNAKNGIMLHHHSNSNWVINNLVRGNADGIVIYDSHQNFIQDNHLVQNGQGIRLNQYSSSNLITANQIDNQLTYGIYLYDHAGRNLISQNIITNNSRGIYLKTDTNSVHDNTLSQNHVGIYLSTAANNYISENDINRNLLYGLRSQGKETDVNYLSNNIIAYNLFNLMSR